MAKTSTTRKPAPAKLKQLQVERERTLNELRATETHLRRAQMQHAEAMVMQLGYKAAEASRVRKDYRRNLGSEDALLGREREKVMRFSRNLSVISGVYRSFIRQSVNLIVGTGLVPVGKGQSTPADKLVKAFMEWADQWCDARGMVSFGGLQRLVVASLIVDGDIASALGSDGERDFLQIVESDMIISPVGVPASHRGGVGKTKDKDPRPRIVDGIELGPLGEVKAVHVSEYDFAGNSVKLSRPTAVPANQIIFLAMRDRHSQTRGVPYIASALDRLAGFDETFDAVEVATKVHASLGVVVTSAASGTMRSLVETGSQDTVSADGTQTQQSLTRQEPGSWWFLNPGEDIKTVQGSTPNSTFDAYAAQLLRLCAGPTGMPVEIAMGDFSKSNFSVSRMADMYAQNSAKPIRCDLERNFCKRVFHWWVAREILRGKLDASAAETARDVSWRAPKRDWIDPEKEVAAAANAMNNNLTTLRDECAKRGEDWEEMLEQIALENKRMKELGIERVQMPGAARASGQSGVASGEKPEPDDDDAEDDAED